MNIEHCLESCWLPVEPSKAGGALKERIVQIQMEYWSFITNDDVQVYQSMWSVHNPTCGHQMCLWYYRWREMRVGEMRLSFERGRMEGGRAIERRAGSSCLPLSWSITHFPHISCKCMHKGHYNQMNRVEVKSASVTTGKGCWQCGSVESGTMDWGKDHNRTRNWVLLALVILLFNNYGESAHILELDN